MLGPNESSLQTGNTTPLHAERQAIVNDFLDITTHEENSEILNDLKSHYNQDLDLERTMGTDCETSQI